MLAQDAAKVAFLEALKGERYSTRNPQRHTINSGEADCSGYVFKTLWESGVWIGGAVSGSELAWCLAHGGQYVSRDFARTHPMVLCVVGGTSGTGSGAHVALSTGDDRIFETPSAAGRKPGVDPMSRNFAAGASNRQYCTIPGFDYSVAGPAGPAPAAAPGTDWVAFWAAVQAKNVAFWAAVRANVVQFWKNVAFWDSLKKKK
jgi:hypothetical protein